MDLIARRRLYIKMFGKDEWFGRNVGDIYCWDELGKFIFVQVS